MWRTRRQRWFIFTASATVIGAGIVCWLAPKNTLLDRSEMIALVRDQGDLSSRAPSMAHVYQVEWLNDTQIFVLDDGTSCTSYTMDLTTNQIREHVVLNRWLRWPWGRSRPRLDSTRRALLWRTQALDSTEVEMARVDGTAHAIWASGLRGCRYVGWLPGDQGRWVGVSETRGYVHGVLTRDYQLVFYVKDRPVSAKPLSALFRERTIVLDGNARLHAYPHAVESVVVSAVPVAEADLGALDKVHIVMIKLPSAGRCAMLEWSPDGTEIAILLICNQQNPVVEFLSSFLHLQRPDSLRASIIVEHSDGTRIRQLGQISLHDTLQLQSMRWSPNGQRLSYMYGDRLYSILVPH